MTQCKNETLNSSSWHPICDTPTNIANSANNEDNRILFYFSNNLINPEKTTNSTKNFLDNLFFTVQPGKV